MRGPVFLATRQERPVLATFIALRVAAVAFPNERPAEWRSATRTREALRLRTFAQRGHDLAMTAFAFAYCMIANNRQLSPWLGQRERRRVSRRVENGLLTANAIRGRPVKGLSLADFVRTMVQRRPWLACGAQTLAAAAFSVT